MTYEEELSLINETSSIEELISAIETIGIISGTEASYNAKTLITKLWAIVDNPGVVDPKTITRSLGIRSKVMELSGLYDTEYIKLFCQHEQDDPQKAFKDINIEQ